MVWGNASLDDAALPDFLVDLDSEGDSADVSAEEKAQPVEAVFGEDAPGADLTGAEGG